MPKKKIVPSSAPAIAHPPNGKPAPSFFDVQPSWTGRGTEPNKPSRIAQWVCSADRCTPQTETFTENINWRIFRIMAEFVEGFEFLSKIERAVTVFGSARVTESNKYYQTAKELGMLCGKNGFTMITGGGPGIMEAANWGAHDSGGDSIGLDISLPSEQRRNEFVKQAMGFHYFFTRKVMLSASAQAYVFFPGGFGTLDELFEMVSLIQTRKMSDQVPVILVGASYWKPMLDWIKKTIWEENRFIEKPDILIFNVVDTAKAAFDIIKKTKERGL